MHFNVSYECNATPPTFGITIGGIAFDIDARDMLPEADLYHAGDNCMTGMQPGNYCRKTTGPFLLGDSFLKNVAAVYDIGGTEMRFAQGAPY